MTGTLPPSVTSTATVDGRAVRYRVDGAGPPVLLLHGVDRSLEDWAEQHELLRDRCRVYSLDLAGCGASAPLGEPYSLPAMARFVAGFLDAVGVADPVRLVGNSLGAAVAMQLVGQEPQRVSSVVLVDPVGFGTQSPLPLRLLTVPGLDYLLLHPRPTMALLRERDLFHDKKLVTPQRRAHAVWCAMRPGAMTRFLEIVRYLTTFRGPRPGWREQMLDGFLAREVPALVIWGDRDTILPVAQLAEARRLLPAARTHVFTDCGHLPQVERAGEFSELVKAFWADVEAAG